MSPSRSAGFWRRRRVLVTGATGFIGAWLVEDLLARRASVAALVMPGDPSAASRRREWGGGVRALSGRLEDLAALDRAFRRHRPDTVFHLGAQTLVGEARRNPWSTLESNVRGTYNLLEVCRRRAAFVRRVVVASSDKAYGTSPRLPCREETPLRGCHPYDVSKSCADLLAQAFHRTYGLPVVVARCGNVFGGGDLHWSRLVPGTVRAFLAGRHPVIRSDGAYVRDYIYVKDVVRAYELMAERLGKPSVRGEAFNFSLEGRVTVLGLVRRLQALMGTRRLAPDVRKTARHEIRVQTLSAAKARRLLGWRPRYTLEEGLRETVAWYRDRSAAGGVR